MNILFIGLSITSSWGNGHATTYRALIRELARRGHDIQFLERDVPWYASQRDFIGLPRTRVSLYRSLEELQTSHAADVARADAVIVGSYVPEGVAVSEWAIATARGPVAYYDIDTPVTLARLERNGCEYLSYELIPKFDLFLSFAGGKTLKKLEKDLGSPRARAFYCSVDPDLYHPQDLPEKWLMGYLGTYSDDRQPALERLLLEPARAMPEDRFIVAGPQYPGSIVWPENVEWVEHLPPDQHRMFYNSQRFTLNVTRSDMVAAGHSPSVRLFEAAACGVPIISDYWDGLDEIFTFGSEILIAENTGAALKILRETPPGKARAIGRAGRARILARHTAAHRAAELEGHLQGLRRRSLAVTSS